MIALKSYNNVSVETQNFEDFHVKDAIDAALHNLNSSIKETGAEIHYENNMPNLYGCEIQIMLLFQNLIANSIKYCERAKPTISISYENSGEMHQFTLKDNGIGIEGKNLKSIFEPLKRLHSSSKYSGSGIGLATCAKIIERHGGEIWCESKIGEGSTFLFNIPHRV